MCLSTDSRYVHIIIGLNFHFSFSFLSPFFFLVSKDSFSKFMCELYAFDKKNEVKGRKIRKEIDFLWLLPQYKVYSHVFIHFPFLHHFPVKIYLAAGCLVHIYLLYCMLFLSFNFFTSYFQQSRFRFLLTSTT